VTPEAAVPRFLLDIALPVPLAETFTYGCTVDDGGRLPSPGDLVRAPLGRRRGVIGLVVAVREDPAHLTEIAGRPLRDVQALLPPEYHLGDDRLALARWIASYYAVPLGEVVPLFHPPSPGTKGRRTATAPEVFPLDEAASVTLTAAQSVVVDLAQEVLARGEFAAVLVHGVTGSGKTEVFLRAIEASLARGRGAIYLLPEIALTPQTLARVTARFGDRVAALHSGLAAGERCRVHEAAARGEIQVVVGPRSALFAPVRDLGVIVVDEEHETSYKQDDRPRYHARDAALVRGRESRAVVLLGSATPDLGSWYNGREGRHRLLILPDRVGGALPQVEIVDLRGTGVVDGFSPRLVEAIGDTLGRGRQVILYYNRRGFARQLQCGDCGEVVMCPRCDIGLTYHLRPRRLLCHYCGHAEVVPDGCPVCKAAGFLPAGGGTEKVELSLCASFPEARVARLDADSTSRRGSHATILSAFARGETDVLVGTQMVAKGHHLPGVELVGVLAADDGLSLPDYRASERAFQLLAQVAGRAGRTSPGTVVFQTWQPDHPVVLAAAAHDYVTFAGMELAARRVLGYPPFRRLVRLGVTAPAANDAEAAAAQLAGALRENLAGPDRDVLGPAPAVFPRLQGRCRHQVLIKGGLTAREKAWLVTCANALRATRRGLEMMIDVDPLGLF
jgi:primosomal protein N' (replication factor Y)